MMRQHEYIFNKLLGFMYLWVPAGCEGSIGHGRGYHGIYSCKWIARHQKFNIRPARHFLTLAMTVMSTKNGQVLPRSVHLRLAQR